MLTGKVNVHFLAIGLGKAWSITVHICRLNTEIISAMSLYYVESKDMFILCVYAGREGIAFGVI